MRPTLFLALLPLALAACQREPADPEYEHGEAAVGRPASELPTDSFNEPVPTDIPTKPDATPGIPEGGIPIALQGNWGMVPADCTSTRGDAKGLLRISATTLTFYESVGKLSTIKDRSDKSIRADFGFSGEGMTWTRDETLALSNGDKQLTRTERGGDEPGGPFTYKKCVG